ncbi:MAG: CaiB/BaiF CoA transferase family protein, partial [Hyphomicrobiaceae bacterium]
CSIGILLALLEREQSGEGQWVHTSLLQAMIFMLDFQASRWLNKQDVPGQAGNNHPTSIPTGVFKTKDGHINIAAAGQGLYERLCKAIGAPELLENPDFAAPQARSANRDKLNPEIEKRLAARTSAEWVAALNEAGVPCGPINSIDQTFADPQVAHLGIAKTVQRGDGVDVHVVGQPVQLSRTPSKATAASPEWGEHTDEVLTEFGFSAAEIADLRSRNLI